MIEEELPMVIVAWLSSFVRAVSCQAPPDSVGCAAA